MRVAIVGAGAAGLTAAHLLDPHHDVVLFERQPIVGGHVRTLGGNVARPDLGSTRLDAGVIEFESINFPTVMRLFARLGLRPEPVPGDTTFIGDDGQILSEGALAEEGIEGVARFSGLAALLPCLPRRALFEGYAALSGEAFSGQRLDDYLDDVHAFDQWLRLLALYAWSVPWEHVGELPAALAVPTLRAFLEPEQWWRLPGGSFAYQEAILGRLRADVRVDADVRARREEDGVWVSDRGGPEERFDHLILGVPPGEVLGVLTDASPRETARFAAWRTRRIHTLIHDDDGPYVRRGATVRTEFDVFRHPPGYNARLDRLCRLASDQPRYGLSFGLDAEIDPARVLHRQAHDVPAYTVAALSSRAEIQEHQGDRRTWFVGAWLGDGLHEGAISSADAVAARLGGDRV
jgi:predicted NAD/FAD-binding protein